jgi:hypothetical protein
MKRFTTLIACAAGLAALLFLLPLFDAPQPRGARITRAEARAVADRAIHDLGVDLDKVWGATTWDTNVLLEANTKTNRAAAQADSTRSSTAHPRVPRRVLLQQQAEVPEQL